jgi:hypothetical protein
MTSTFSTIRPDRRLDLNRFYEQERCALWNGGSGESKGQQTQMSQAVWLGSLLPLGLAAVSYAEISLSSIIQIL